MSDTFVFQKLRGDYVYDFLRSAFDEDKQLHSQNCLSWGKSVEQLKTIFNLDTLDLSHVQFSKEMSTYYSGKIGGLTICTPSICFIIIFCVFSNDKLCKFSMLIL
jgi:hypothetical protein